MAGAALAEAGQGALGRKRELGVTPTPTAPPPPLFFVVRPARKGGGGGTFFSFSLLFSPFSVKLILLPLPTFSSSPLSSRDE